MKLKFIGFNLQQQQYLHHPNNYISKYTKRKEVNVKWIDGRMSCDSY